MGILWTILHVCFVCFSRKGGCIIPHQKIFLKPSKYQIKITIKNATPKYSINYKSVITWYFSSSCKQLENKYKLLLYANAFFYYYLALCSNNFKTATNLLVTIYAEEKKESYIDWWKKIKERRNIAKARSKSSFYTCFSISHFYEFSK